MKKKQIVIYIVLMFTLLCTSVYATVSGNIVLNSSANTVTAGDEFTVTLSLEDVISDNGIDSINGYINIDEDVLEDLTVSSISTNSAGKVVISSGNILNLYDASSTDVSNIDTGVIFSDDTASDDYEIIINLASTITSDTDLITITFKVKSDVSAGTYEDVIGYSLSIESEGEEISAGSESLDIKVTAATSSDNTSANNTTTSNNVINNNSNSSTTNSTSNVTNNVVDNTVATGVLPNAGYRLLIIPIVAVISVIGVMLYRKYKKI